MLRIAILFAVLSAAPLSAQDWTSPTNMSGPVVVETSKPVEVRDGFRSALVKAIRAKVRSGELSRSDAVRIRVAMISPAFRKHVEDLAITQMVFSGVDSDAIPFDDAGKVERASINWDSLLDYLGKLLPLIISLLDLFGA